VETKNASPDPGGVSLCGGSVLSFFRSDALIDRGRPAADLAVQSKQPQFLFEKVNAPRCLSVPEDVERDRARTDQKIEPGFFRMAGNPK
jgi:hypothetical protein